MQRAGVQLAVKDYQHLIKTASWCGLLVEVRRWGDMARAAGVFHQLDEASRLAALPTLPSQLSDRS